MRRSVFLLALSAMLVLCTVGCQNPAQSESTTFTITFDSQSATTAADPVTKTVISPAATTVDALPTTPVKTGYNFGGWWTAVDGGGTEFTASTEVTANITVYAKWLNTTISFNANGGAGTTTAVVLDADDSAVTLRTLANSFTYTDKAFYGWSKTADGPIVAATETLSPGSGDLTLYARWHDSVSHNLEWFDLRSSDDMKYLVAVAVEAADAGGLYVSNDYGLSWTKKISWAATLGDAQGGILNDCDVSANGQYMMGVSRSASANGAIWYSSDYGTTWTNIGTSLQGMDFSTKSLQGCALSDDGTKRVVAAYGDKVYEWNGTAWGAVTGSPANVIDIDYAGNGGVFVVGQWDNDTYAFPGSGSSYSLDTYSGVYSGSGTWQGRELLVSKNGDMVLFAPKPGAFNATLWSLSGTAQSAPLGTISDSHSGTSATESNGTAATWNTDGSFKTAFMAAGGRGVLKFAVPASPSGTIAPTLLNGTELTGATTLQDKLTGWLWNGIAVSPDEQTLVALAAYVDGTKPGGVYLSTDGGATWTRVY